MDNYHDSETKSTLLLDTANSDIEGILLAPMTTTITTIMTTTTTTTPTTTTTTTTDTTTTTSVYETEGNLYR